MSKFLEKMQNSPTGLYDSDTGDSLFAYKTVDFSEYCPKSKQFIVKYTEAKRGRIAQLNDLYKKGKDLGIIVHFFINEMTVSSLSSNSVFASRCRIMGASPIILARHIFKNQ